MSRISQRQRPMNARPGGASRGSGEAGSGGGLDGPGGAQLALEGRGRREPLGGADVESLGVVDSVFAGARGFGVLDAFGDRVLAEAAGDADDRFDDFLVGVAGGELADEVDVDLEVARWDVFEVGERPEAGPEVIERDRAAVVGECCGEGARGREVSQSRRSR